MPLDYNNTRPCYLHGRLVALIELECCGKLPKPFVAISAPGTNNQSFFYWAKEALKSDNKELADVANKTDLVIPKADDGSYYVGYYHQKSANHILLIGRAIAERRMALGLSVRELGARVGVSYTTLSLIENGKMNPSIGTLTKITDELGLTIEVK